MSELNPCPFCGSEAKIEGAHSRGFYIECSGCQKQTRLSAYPEDAMKAWNTRASEAAIRAQVIEEVRANVRNITDHIGVEYLSILKLSEMLDRMKSEGGKA